MVPSPNTDGPFRAFRESGMGWYCDGSIHYGVVWDAGAYYIAYYIDVQ